MIEIVPPKSYATLDASIAQLPSYDWLVFTSANAVQAFAERRALLLHTGAHELEHAGSRAQLPKVAAIGQATARAVRGIGFPVDLIPLQYVAESLAESLAPHASGSDVLLVRAVEARDALPDRLRAAGARVTIAEAYRNQTPPGAVAALEALFRSAEDYPDAITFTSASTVRNLFSLLASSNLELPAGVALASIGPITSEALRELGRTRTIEADVPTIDALVASLAVFFSSDKVQQETA
ncbi:MAG: uroporphyrinogen-III synthase [Acidobacteriota bacterium]|nr:uroporphyrinogen-III synthase [Acidobacteriota bacterium]